MQIDGNKVYILSAGAAILAVLGYVFGVFDMATAGEMLFGSGIFASLRHAIAKTEAKKEG